MAETTKRHQPFQIGRVTPEQLSTYVQLFKNNLQALENHCGLLQLALATSQTLKHPECAKWDNFLAFERLLLQNIGESDLPKVLCQLLPMVKSHNERKANDYGPEDLLVLLVYIYSIVGEIPLGTELDAAEAEMKKSLVRVFSDEPELSDLLQKITGVIPHLATRKQQEYKTTLCSYFGVRFSPEEVEIFERAGMSQVDYELDCERLLIKIGDR